MIRLETLDKSQPSPQSDGLQFVSVKSTHLQGRGDITFFDPAPQQADRPTPLVILLHGVYSSHWAWAFKGGAHRTLAALVAAKKVPRMILAMPSDGLAGDGSAYCQHKDGRNFESWIVDDVPACARALYPKLLSETSPQFIGGLSMGGFGALRMGARNPSKFAGISAHSPVTTLDELASFVEEPHDRFAEPLESLSPLYWLRKNQNALPPMRMDCGVDDRLFPGFRALHESLAAESIPHVCEEFPGGHSWDYWREHVAKTFAFFAAQI